MKGMIHKDGDERKVIKKVRIEWISDGNRTNKEFDDVVGTLQLQAELKDLGIRYELHVLSDIKDEYNGFDLLPNVWCRVG